MTCRVSKEAWERRSGIGEDERQPVMAQQVSAEKLEHTGPAEKKRVASVPQREQMARTPEPPLPKGKGTELSVQSTRS